jgi:hypothetical protein
MKVYLLTEYGYSYYYYGGVVENNISVFSSYEKAKDYANESKLKIVGEAGKDTHCTIECHEVD